MMNINKDIEWNNDSYCNFINYLKCLREEKYRIFSEKLIFTKYNMLGIRIPILRSIAKKLSKTNFKDLFSLFKNEYYEVVLIEGLLISYVDDYQLFVVLFKEYVKKIDNWAICDTVVSSLKIINKNKLINLDFIKYLLNEKNEYSRRCAFVMLLDFYVEEEYINKIFDFVSKCKTEDYYVNMAISWLMCECFIKFSKETYHFIENNDLGEFVIRKTVSKISDSYRVSKEDKERLKKLRDQYLCK